MREAVAPTGKMRDGETIQKSIRAPPRNHVCADGPACFAHTSPGPQHLRTRAKRVRPRRQRAARHCVKCGRRCPSRRSHSFRKQGAPPPSTAHSGGVLVETPKFHMHSRLPGQHTLFLAVQPRLLVSHTHPPPQKNHTPSRAGPTASGAGPLPPPAPFPPQRMGLGIRS